MSESRAIWALVLSIAGVIAGIALFSPIWGLVKLVPDDGFYYLEIARRIGTGQGSTFDGIHPTNGYHPLWLIVLVPLAPILQWSRLLGARIALVLGLLSLLAALSLAQRITARHAPEHAMLAVLWLSCTLLVASVYGMEAPLAVLLAASMWHALAKSYPENLSGGLWLGSLGAALFFARLDAVIPVFAVHLVWAFHVIRRNAALRPFLAALLLQGTLGIAYLAINQAMFDAWMPVSASLKASRQGGVSLRWLSSLLAVLGVGSAGLSCVALVVARDPLRQSIALGTLLSMLSIALGGGRETYNWYFALPVFGGGLLLPSVVALLRSHGIPKHLLHGALWSASLLLLAVSFRGKMQTTGFQEKITRAMWLSDHASDTAIFAEGDCGLLGYLSRRPFVNLDGLTNTADFLDAIDEGSIDDWLMQSGVNAIALPTSSEVHPDAVLIARGRHRGQKVWMRPILSPWDPPISDAAYTLWHIDALEIDSP